MYSNTIVIDVIQGCIKRLLDCMTMVK